MALPIVDLSPLLAVRAGGKNDKNSSGSGDNNRTAAAVSCCQCCVQSIGKACREEGFFYIIGHGIDPALPAQLQRSAAEFFALPRAIKRRSEMAKGGKAWRGYFEVGEELTSGLVDEKEGLYFGEELDESESRPLHGPNLWPAPLDVGEELAASLRAATLSWIDAMTELGMVILEAIASSLGLEPGHFGPQFRAPTKLFRIFNYPPHDSRHYADSFAVGEHTDYGYLTLLWQDDNGGLQVQGSSGEWIEAPPVHGSFIINLGDALEHNTGGLLRATAHRVAPRAGALAGRLSFPFFLDPSFDAVLTSVVDKLPIKLQEEAARRRASRPERWDGENVQSFGGKTCESQQSIDRRLRARWHSRCWSSLADHGLWAWADGEHLVSRVSRVFPHLLGKL